MVGPWPHRPYSFRALRATFGEMWLRCDFCRRFAALRIPRELRDHDYRRFRFSCSKCGGEATHCVIHPHKDGYPDYREDQPNPRRHPAAEERMRLRRGEWIAPKLRWKPTR